jgi:type I restriction enzyme, S subunit
MPREKLEQHRGVGGVMAETSSLPKSWAWTTIGDVVEHTIEQGPPKGESTFLYVDIGSIDTKIKKISEPKTLPTSKAPTRAKQHLKPRDVIVSMTRPNLNSVAMVPQEMSKAIGSTGFCVLRPIDTIPALMFYLVQAESFVSAMSLLVQGALYPAVRPKDILAYRFPLPPLEEQYRIVAKIEELFTKLDAGIRELRHARAQLTRYRQSVLNTAITGELTKQWREAHQGELESAAELLARILKERREKWEQDELARMESEGKTPNNNNWKEKYREPSTIDSSKLPSTDGWRWIALELVAKAIDPQPSHRTPPAFDNGIPYVGMGDVRKDKKIDLENARKVSAYVLAEHRERYQLKEGDFFIGKIGTIGKPVKLSSPFDYALSANIVLIQPNPSYTAGRFAFLYMSSPLVERLLATGSRATTQSAFGIQKVRLLPYPLPPLSEQCKVVEEVERSLSICEATDNAIEQGLKQAERMRQSILKQAFEGKLVPQDPNDEPAELLLERIKIERAKRGAEKSVTTRRRTTSC